jgi:hypothetical protein
MVSETPSTNGSNGRTTAGRFAKGNLGGPGNPHARRAARLRSALFKAVTPDDLRDVIHALLTAAKGGDVSAAKELMQRLLGPPEAIDLLERMEALEAKIEQAAQR